MSMGYSLPSTGQITLTVGANSATQPYLQVGDYFLTGTEAALGASTKE
jgi:hypothetical protein